MMSVNMSVPVSSLARMGIWGFCAEGVARVSL